MIETTAYAPADDATGREPTELTQLVSYLSRLDCDDIPTETVRLLKLCVLDTLGCLIAGSSTEVAAAMYRAIEGPRALPSQGGSSVIASQVQTSAETAALINGTVAHSLIFDDMHRTAKIHPGVFTVPSLLAMNDSLDVDGATFLAAVCAGYELSSRIGIAINMAEHRAKGWRATGTVGSLGAAAACARLLNLPPAPSHHAVAAAAAQASGTFAFADGGGMELYLAGGTAARNGVSAAVLAAGGLRAASDPLLAADGGLFVASSANFDASVMTADLGMAFALEEVCIKMHPTCHSTQTAIDAMLELRAEHDVRLRDVASIVVEAGEITRLQCGWEYYAATPELMVFHMGFILASILETGQVSSVDLSGPLLHDREYVRIAQATTVVAVDELTAIYKQKKPSIVHLYLHDGRVLSTRVDYCKGDPENRATDAEVIRKFTSLTANNISASATTELVDLVLNLEQQPSVTAIGQILRNATRLPAHANAGHVSE